MLNLKNSRFTTKLMVLIGAFSAGCVVLGVAGFVAVRHDGAGGPEAERVSLASSLESLTNASPLLLAEAFATSHQLLTQPDATRAELLERWRSLAASHAEARESLLTTFPESELKHRVTTDGLEPARQFFSVAEHDFLPAIASGDKAAAAAILEIGRAHV